MKLLITGFDPFGGETTNPSWEVVRKLPDKISSLKLIKRELPTEFLKAQKLLESYILKHKPDFVISVGQAGGRASINLEKVAINLMEARIADNSGYQPKNKPIVEDGPDGYFTNLPVEKMEENLKKENIPAHISYTAGTFVCNTVFYKAQYIREKNNLDFKSGFIHVPFLPEQVLEKGKNAPSMSKEMIKRGLEVIVETLI